MGEVEVNVASLGFCYVVTFNKWDKHSKQHISLGMICELINQEQIWQNNS